MDIIILEVYILLIEVEEAYARIVTREAIKALGVLLNGILLKKENVLLLIARI